MAVHMSADLFKNNDHFMSSGVYTRSSFKVVLSAVARLMMKSLEVPACQKLPLPCSYRFKCVSAPESLRQTLLCQGTRQGFIYQTGLFWGRIVVMADGGFQIRAELHRKALCIASSLHLTCEYVFVFLFFSYYTHALLFFLYLLDTLTLLFFFVRWWL